MLIGQKIKANRRARDSCSGSPLHGEPPSRTLGPHDCCPPQLLGTLWTTDPRSIPCRFRGYSTKFTLTELLASAMKYWMVIMYVEIGSFVICFTGWVLVCSTMPTEYWNYSTVEGIVLTTANYFSNLWKDCISDSTGVSDCKEFPSLLGLESKSDFAAHLQEQHSCWCTVHIHLCRALVISSIILGFFGAVLALVGMKCTKIGGSEPANARVTFAAGMNYLISGLCGMSAFSIYGNRIREEYVDPNFKAQKFEIGAAVFIGWGGSSLLIIGGLLFSIFGGKDGFRSSLPTPSRPATSVSTQPQKSQGTPLPEEDLESRRTRPNRSFSKDAYV